jgi:hypothetical protein
MLSFPSPSHLGPPRFTPNEPARSLAYHHRIGAPNRKVPLLVLNEQHPAFTVPPRQPSCQGRSLSSLRRPLGPTRQLRLLKDGSASPRLAGSREGGDLSEVPPDAKGSKLVTAIPWWKKEDRQTVRLGPTLCSFTRPGSGIEMCHVEVSSSATCGSEPGPPRDATAGAAEFRSPAGTAEAGRFPSDA